MSAAGAEADHGEGQDLLGCRHHEAEAELPAVAGGIQELGGGLKAAVRHRKPCVGGRVALMRSG